MLQWLNVDILYIPIVVYIVPQKNKALQKVHTVSGPATVPRALTCYLYSFTDTDDQHDLHIT